MPFGGVASTFIRKADDNDIDGRIVGIELLDARAQLSAELLSDAA